jgi:hypothetical protein
MSIDSAEFRKEEYKSVRAEILERIREANSLILTTAGGVGGAYAILVTTFARKPYVKFSHAPLYVNAFFVILMWTPFIFSVLAKLKSREIWEIVTELAAYTRKIEDLEYGQASPIPGWEHCMVVFRGRRKSFQQNWASQPYTRIYRFMMATTSVVALVATVYVGIVSVRRS